MEPQPQIDKTSPVPLYHQLRGVLEYLIRKGTYMPGEPIPGENDLCDSYDVSRTTVRQTISEMLRDGVLYRQKKRGRPLVTPVVVRQSLLKLQGFFTEGMLTAGLKPHTTVLSVQKRIYTEIAERMSLPAETVFYRIERIHGGNNFSLALQISYIPVSVCPDLEQHHLQGSLFAYIEHDYGHPIVTAKQVIGIRQSDNRTRELMQLPHRLPMFLVERVSFAKDRKPVEYFECLLRSDRYDFEMELNWQADGRRLSGEPVMGLMK